MLTIKKFTVNFIEENCFVIHNDKGEGAIIDCGAYDAGECCMIADYIEQEGLELKYVLQTHSHFDHIFGLPFLHATYGLSPWMHEDEKPYYDRADQMCKNMLGVGFPVPMPQAGNLLKEGDIIDLGDDSLKVIHTPGHTAGGICFYQETQHILFSGDTLFNGSIGRTDLEGGDPRQEMRSICEKLLPLPEDTVVYSGHGLATTIGNEKINNWYLKS